MPSSINHRFGAAAEELVVMISANWPLPEINQNGWLIQKFEFNIENYKEPLQTDEIFKMWTHPEEQKVIT